MIRRSFLALAGLTSATALAACSTNNSGSSSATSTTSAAAAQPDPELTLPTAWQHDADNDVYYQLGVTYVKNPQAADIETLGIYVPAAAYKDGAVDWSHKVVIPVNTPGYASQAAPTEYSYDSISAYMKAGLIYVQPGLRGKDSFGDGYKGNAPWGVVDLKSTVRYLRSNGADKIFTFGHSGGGAQSALAGATGNSEMYTPYLSELGAADADDSITGAMCWCPVTSLDEANLGYEWQMGQFATTDTRAEGTWTRAYSQDLAKAFPAYINGLELRDSEGTVLKLEESSDGIYLAGTYYDHLMSVIENSLNEFLKATEFPYTPSSVTMAGMHTGLGQTGASGNTAGAPSGGGMPSGAPAGMPSGAPPAGMGGGMPGMPGGQEEDTTTYNTVEEYIAKLNESETWVDYDSSSNTAKVKSLKGFVNSQKSASKNVGALDSYDRSATENLVMGIGDSNNLHFSQMSKQVMDKANYSSYSDWNDDYAATGYETDFTQKDELGTDVLTREKMYNPMYFLAAAHDGYDTTDVAPHWRIHTGIKQGDTPTTTEMNIALALGMMDRDVEFSTVWGQGHTMAELTGDADSNFIEWVSKI